MKIPGSKSQKIIDRHWKAMARTTNEIPLVARRAEGVYVFTPEGQKLMDFNSGVGVSNIGFKDSYTLKEIVKQLKTGLWQYIGTDFHNELQVKVGEKLNEITPGNFPKRTFLCNSGTEAVEAAMKLCYPSKPERRVIIAFTGSFHGRTLGALSLTSSKDVQRRYFPHIPDVYHFAFPGCYTSISSRCPYGRQPDNCEQFCINFIENEYCGRLFHPEEINAVFLEVIQGEGGIRVAHPQAIERLKEFCKKYNILMVVDEVQTGFGRTGKMFACEHYNLEPDIITMAKSISGGASPMGAVTFREELNWKELGMHSNTNGGHVVACAAALASIKIIENRRLAENAAKMGEVLKERLLYLWRKYNNYLAFHRGFGLMQGIDFINQNPNVPFLKLRNTVVMEALKRGLILMGAGHPQKNPSLRFMPPLIIKEEEIHKAMDIFEQALKASLKQLKGGRNGSKLS